MNKWFLDSSDASPRNSGNLIMGSCHGILNCVELLPPHDVDNWLLLPKMAPLVDAPLLDVCPIVFLPLKFGCINTIFFFRCIGRTWGCRFHTDGVLDWISSVCPWPWTFYFPFIHYVHDFLNLLHSLDILYLFFISFQALSIIYGSLLIIHFILLGYSTTRLSSFFHYLLYLVFFHHY